MTSAFSTSPHSATKSPSSVSVYFQGMPWMHTCTCTNHTYSSS